MNNLIKRVLFLFKGRIVCTGLGIIAALLFVHYGIIRTLFILAMAGIGYFIGNRLDSDEDLHSLLERILPPVD